MYMYVTTLYVMYHMQVVALTENGEEKEVTEENKLEYLNLLAQHRLVRSVKEETDAFLKGKALLIRNMCMCTCSLCLIVQV